jgi:hypothetical protein
MARLYTCGFELNSGTAGVEFTGLQGSLFTIQGTTKRTGSYAGTVVGGATATAEQQIASADGAGPWYARIYIYITTAPSVITGVLYIGDSGGTQRAAIAIETDLTLKLADSTEQIGGPSAALSLNKWYRLELKYYNNTASGNAELAGYYALENQPGILIASTVHSVRTGGASYCRVGNHTGAGTFVAYFDDWAINDSTGSFQNSYPGPGHVAHFKPTGSGDGNTWQKSNGDAGDANNYNQVFELTPDDATTYLKRIATTIKVDDYNVTDPSTAGIDSANININAIQVGIRGGAISATASTARDVLLRIKKAASGTVSKSGTSQNRLNINGWTTHTTVAPKLYKLTLYNDPDGSPWTYGTLISMQIGCENQTSSTTEVRMSTIWAAVDYVPRNARAKAWIIPATGNKYTKGDASTLPTTTAELSTRFIQADYNSVSLDNSVRVSQIISQNGMFLFKAKAPPSSTQVTVTWNGQSTIAPLQSTVFLQFYNVNTTTWTTFKQNNTAVANDDFTLTDTISSGLADYIDTSNFFNIRVYQGDID